jgi:polysaccharide export outer membrane protein
MMASGFTPIVLQSDLADWFKDLVKNPIVTVTVREITNSKVNIFGGRVQGVFELNRLITLLQILCFIGNGSAGGGRA